ncbi:hypothetical protein J3E68DRAFT_430906 [Trichoderma sp. SZMC 28012]
MTLLKPQPTPRPRGDSVSSNASFRSAISFHSDTSYQSAASFVAVGYAEAVEPPGSATSPDNTTAGPSNLNPSSSTPSGDSASSVHPHHTKSTNSNPSVDSASPSVSTTSCTTEDDAGNQQSRNEGAHSD